MYLVYIEDDDGVGENESRIYIRKSTRDLGPSRFLRITGVSKLGYKMAKI